MPGLCALAVVTPCHARIWHQLPGLVCAGHRKCNRLKLLRMRNCLFELGARCCCSEAAAGFPLRVAGVADRKSVIPVGGRVVNSAAGYPGYNTTVGCFWVDAGDSRQRQGLWDMSTNGGALVLFEHLVPCDPADRVLVRAA